MSDRGNAIIELIVESGEAGRVDRLLAARFPAIGRRALAAVFAAGEVRVNGRRAKKGMTVAAGDRIALRPPEPPAKTPITPQPGPLEILFEDDELVVVNKPAAMPSHPLRVGELDTLANRLVAHYPAMATVAEDYREAGLVHRLDTPTSGCLAAAKSRAAWLAWRARLSNGSLEKHYLAAVCGPIADQGECRAALAHRGDRMVVVPDTAADGLTAVTRWSVIDRCGEHALVRVVIDRGRRHQVRAHLAASGAAIVGDPIYGGPQNADGLFLHASELANSHGTPWRVHAPLPGQRLMTLRALGLRQP